MSRMRSFEGRTKRERMLAWLRFAIDLEERGLDFYRKCLAESRHPRAMELFDYLVNAETGHRKVLKSALEAYTKGNKDELHRSIHEFVRLDVKRPLFDRDSQERMASPGTALHDIFNRALAFEKEGMEFYRGLAEGETDKDLEALFTKLADDEVDHAQKLRQKFLAS